VVANFLTIALSMNSVALKGEFFFLINGVKDSFKVSGELTSLL
jgi:hypothetical protein